MNCSMWEYKEESEFIISHEIEFNDRVVSVEETKEGVKLRATGRGFKAVRDTTRNKWICYTPIPSGFKSAYKKKFLENFDSEYRVHIGEVTPDTTIFTFAFKEGYLRDNEIHWECPWARNAHTYPKEFIEAVKNSFNIDIHELPVKCVKRRVSSDSLDI